jgi:hypothetical protein
MKTVFNVWFVLIPIGVAYALITLLRRRRRLP